MRCNASAMCFQHTPWHITTRVSTLAWPPTDSASVHTPFVQLLRACKQRYSKPQAKAHEGLLQSEQARERVCHASGHHLGVCTVPLLRQEQTKFVSHNMRA